ncbi:hypothetical protein [Changchengzhania lutea]|uniref:hypothetical protein n=1 Tax=Changchengzhania lutea TaxID=2049305 RepID=UPI001FE95D65|nr:hypothetical protein [Changchengzhania lutea]
MEASLVATTPMTLETLVAIDDFGTMYSITNHVFSKSNTEKTITYNNLQLGHLTTANASNPLKTNLFYQDFNTVIILDNRLAEIFKLDFNQIQPYKNVSHISTGYDNFLWLFNQDLQQLELYDYKLKQTKVRTLPIQSELLDLKSNYNFCWLLTEKFLYVYNYFGSLVKMMKNDGYTGLYENDENLILKKENSLFFLKENTEKVIPIILPDLLIKQFFVTNETLYIYDHEFLHKFEIKTN